MEKRWVFYHQQSEECKKLAGEVNLSPKVAQVLINREINSPEEAFRFLNPSLSNLHDPFLLKDMKKGVERVLLALEKNEKITIFGDYDVDGTTSTSLLLLFLKEIEANCDYYIPDRLHEGYGLNVDAIKKLSRRGTRVIITVDNGISSFKEVELACSLGMDVIITDHHQIPPHLPPAYGVINPQQADCSYPFKELAGVGIALNMVMAIRSGLRERGKWERQCEPNIKKYLDLAALGTIADIAPLTGINRIITVHGLKELSRGNRPGIKALKRVSAIDSGEVNVGGVGFQLGPRLNAAGRMSSADAGVKLLTTEIVKEASTMAEELDSENRKRQAVEKEILEEAVAMVESMKLYEKSSIVIHSENWHPGVIGIVASRLVDRYYKPSLVIAVIDGVGKGSARSIDGFHLYRGLTECSDHLEGFGGHKYAAGITISPEKILPFAENFDRVVKKSVPKEDFKRPLKIESCLSFEEIDDNIIEELERLSPFGASNAEPVFATEDVTLLSLRLLKDAHLKMTFQQEGKTFDAIAFNMAHKRVQEGERFSIAYSLRFNYWNKQKSIQLFIKDIKC
ncbi:MAG: single-stranded-DNA-specific exonuclease RecJ [Deltaproteobacteria bacterium]|nr:single-stranded-DNA-specific exonuclease RecJ [Deltaproteobacteria bacterium]